MLKKLLLIVTTLVVMILFTACSEKDSTSNNGDTLEPPVLAQTPDEVIAFPDSAALVNYEMTQVEYEGEMVDAYGLAQFAEVDRDFIEEIEFDYEIVADDGYSPRPGGNPELTWEQFQTGYLLPTKKFRTFFPSDDIDTAYNVKWAKDLNLYRTVVVVDVEGTHIPFQIGSIDTVGVYHQAGNGNFYTDPGFELSEFISEYVTENPEDFEYHLTASNAETEIFNWEDIQAAYWLTTQNKAVFLNDDGTEFHSSFKHLIKIELM